MEKINLKEKLISSFMAFENNADVDIDSHVHDIRSDAISNFETKIVNDILKGVENVCTHIDNLKTDFIDESETIAMTNKSLNQFKQMM